MPTMADMRRGGTPFDPFLYAYIGEDRNGNTVTVLSALARLGLEPWEAAAEMAALTREEARARLAALLARIGDVPGLGLDQGATARRLIGLLPQITAGRAAGWTRAAPAQAAAARLRSGPVIAVGLAVLVLVLTLITG